MKVSIVGGSGYAGGELLRLLLWHPHVEVAQVTSESMAGDYVQAVHPNLRGHTRLKFSSVRELQPCDLLFLALPHGEAQKQIERFAGLAEKIVDLSGDFRLRSPALYKRWYGHDHAAPQWLDKFVYGLPELHRAELKTARYASGVGCNATAVNLAVYPLFLADVVDRERGVIVEVKGGS
jgi:N-acetyl-gamma-glutamyl-phosphate/LysW-gamma-L-alpha-aminoadipyl-6-phosphate reductase